MMKRMTSWFCDVCGCRSDILEEECPNGCVSTFPVIDLVEKKTWRNPPNLNCNDNMVRVTLDMTKIDWLKLQKHITRIDTKEIP